MSLAEDLLNSLPDEPVAAFALNPETEPHIVINPDRTVTVPESLLHIAVEGDHNIETVTFDCPRYWDSHDLSQMRLRIVFQRPDGHREPHLAENVRVDPDDTNMIHFDWTLSNNVTLVRGNISFTVCAKIANAEGIVEREWHTRLNQDLVVDEGMDCSGEEIVEQNPDIIEAILVQLDELKSTGGTGSNSGQNVSIPASADLNGTTATFRNSAGIALFTLDLSGLGGGSAAVYGNLVLSAEALTITEGQSGMFTVALDQAPSANQPVYLAVSDGSRLSVSPATLTFTPENWETPQTVTVTSLEDDDEEDNAITVTLTSTAVDARQVAVAIRDNDVQLEIVTDGLVLNMDYTGHVGDESDTITDLASGVTFKNFSFFEKQENGVTGGENQYRYLTIVEDDAKEPFMTALKQTGSFSFEYFGTKCPNSGFFTKTGTSQLQTIVETEAQFGWFTDNFAYQSVCTKAMRILQDGSTDNTKIGSDLLYTLGGTQKRMQYHAQIWPYRGEFVHVVLTFSADGRFVVFLNGVGCDAPIAIENFKAWDFDAMFGKVQLLQSETMAGYTTCQRIYNRVLTAEEVTQNMRANAKLLGLETF